MLKTDAPSSMAIITPETTPIRVNPFDLLVGAQEARVHFENAPATGARRAVRNIFPVRWGVANLIF